MTDAEVTDLWLVVLGMLSVVAAFGIGWWLI